MEWVWIIDFVEYHFFINIYQEKFTSIILVAPMIEMLMLFMKKSIQINIV